MAQTLALKESQLTAIQLERDQHKAKAQTARKKHTQIQNQLQAQLEAKDSEIEALKSEFRESAIKDLTQQLEKEQKVSRELRAENQKLKTIKQEYQNILENMEKEVQELRNEKRDWASQSQTRQMRVGLDELKMKMIMLENREEGVRLESLARDFGKLERQFHNQKENQK